MTKSQTLDAVKPGPDYIGDGVYVSFDGYYIWLSAGDHRIALEPEVFAQLLRYARRVNEENDTHLFPVGKQK